MPADPAAAPWSTTRPQFGPVNTGGPGTLAGAASTAKTDPGPDAPPPAWATQQPSRSRGQVADSVAASRAQQESSGYGNADGGSDEMLTRDDLQEHTDALSSRLDALHQSVGNLGT